MGKTRKSSSLAYYRLAMSKKNQGINNNWKKKYMQGVVIPLFLSKLFLKNHSYTVLYKKTMLASRQKPIKRHTHTNILIG